MTRSLEELLAARESAASSFRGYRGNNLVRRYPVTPVDSDTGEKLDWMQPDHPATFLGDATARELIRSGDLDSHWRLPGGATHLNPSHMEHLFNTQATPREGTRDSMEDIRKTGKVRHPIEIHSWSTDHGEHTELVDGHHRLAAMYLHHPDKPIPIKWVDRTPHA